LEEPEESVAGPQVRPAEPQVRPAERQVRLAERQAQRVERQVRLAERQVRLAERQAQRVEQPQAPQEGSAARQEAARQQAARVEWPAQRAQVRHRPTDRRMQEVLADPMEGIVLRSPPSSRARSLRMSGRRFRVTSRRVLSTPLAVGSPVRR
jgi:hypothetical protein